MINKLRVFYKARHERVEDIKMLKDELADMIEKNLELSKQVKQYRFDSLTGLKMRADFEEDSKTMFNRGEKFYLVIADVNGLKNANTLGGYEQGDNLIIKCVADLARCNPMGIENIYRGSGSGGDEFFILVPFSRELHSEDFHCPSDEFTMATKFSSDFESFDSMFKSCNSLLLERKTEFYRNNPNDRREV